MIHDVFISYSRKDSEIVNKITEILSSKGLRLWIDKDGIESGDAFKAVIVRAIKNASVFLFFSSKNSNESPWTIKEVNTAVHLKKPIIPIRLDDADYNDSILFDIGGLDFVDFSDEIGRDAALTRLLHALIGKITTHETPTETKVERCNTLTKSEGFEIGYDLTVFTIHKLRGQGSAEDDDKMSQRLTDLGINPEILFDNLKTDTMIPNISNCAVSLGERYGKDIENCVCLGASFVLSIIAKRTVKENRGAVSEEFGHTYDESIIIACEHLGVPEHVTKKLISSSDDETENMYGELKEILDKKEDSFSISPVGTKPMFNGGEANTFSKWVNSHLNYPKDAKERHVQGTVIVRFTVDKYGYVKDVNVVSGVDPSLDNEAVRVVESSPRWTPARSQGRAVIVTYTFPIIFELN